MVKFQAASENETLDLDYYVPKPLRAPQCLCGRFAKWAGDEHYYNGWFNCYRYFVDCSRCGRVTVECV